MGRDGVNGYTDKEGDTKPDQTAPVTIQHIDGDIPASYHVETKYKVHIDPRVIARVCQRSENIAATIIATMPVKKADQ